MDRRKFFSSAAVAGSAGVVIGTAALTEEKPSTEMVVQNNTGQPITVVLPPVQPGVTITVSNFGNNTLTVKQSL